MTPLIKMANGFLVKSKSNQIKQKKMTPLVKMANGFLVKSDT
jgi:hypothetical protein